MRSTLVLNDLRVQKIKRADGGWSYAILWPDYSVDVEAEGTISISTRSRGGKSPYAYYLVDHLRWRIREGLTTQTIKRRDLYG
ncbi:hypothetical protein [Streptomyces sp. N1]|uniref:hypothetical protein n=1 Tax=Streptomyces sp. N1 TaxID=576456 RepID=UPI0010116B32|nr:hypothetical protein [Streptomyces sp. N1]